MTDDEIKTLVADRVGDALSREVERRTAELAKGLAGWRDHAEQFQREINWLRGELALHRAKAHGDYWAWLGDGTDHPESLTCSVVISANDLRKILAGERERAGKGESKPDLLRVGPARYSATATRIVDEGFWRQDWGTDRFRRSIADALEQASLERSDP